MKLSVIISNRNDVAMLAVTLRSCIEELKALDGESEVVICDNSDKEIFQQVKSIIPPLYIKSGKVQLLRQDFPCLFTARETAAKAAKGTYIACVDSHMLIGRDMFKDLVAFMDLRADDPVLGFAHAPINWAHQHESRSKHDRDLTKSELGPWGSAYPNAKPITWKGMPWICRRDWFLGPLGAYGALSQHRISWGGGDMHIGMKPWLLGFRNWAVPTSPGIHIGPFPKTDIPAGDPNSAIVSNGDGYRYRLWKDSGKGPHAIGFLVSCFVLGGEPMMKRNKPMIKERFGRYINLDSWWEPAKAYGKDEKAWLDVRKVTTFEKLLETKPWDN